MLKTLSFMSLWDWHLKKTQHSDLQVTVFQGPGKNLQQQVHIILKKKKKKKEIWPIAVTKALTII